MNILSPLLSPTAQKKKDSFQNITSSLAMHLVTQSSDGIFPFSGTSGASVQPQPASLVSSQTACSKEMFQLPFPEYPFPQFLLLLSLPGLSSSPVTKVLFVNSHSCRRSLAEVFGLTFSRVPSSSVSGLR